MADPPVVKILDRPGSVRYSIGGSPRPAVITRAPR
jgi:hypothetical protein